MTIAFAALLLHGKTTLSVGDGQAFSRIEDAVRAAKAGDTIEVHARKAPYSEVAVRVQIPKLTIRGIGSPRPVLDGGAFDYSGSGSVPRAIIEIDTKGDGTVVDNLELRGAHNQTFNGSGIRINGAKSVTVLNCDIHGNDMGIMSNGVRGDSEAASRQMIDHCRIWANGNLKDPGYNHNLYLGGTSATIQFCEIYGALTGHNLKSRAHFNLVQYCYVHDSANREMDFVDSWDTERPNSNTVLIGNVVSKDRAGKGNRTVIHFGQESGSRSGTLFAIQNTFVTPFQSPVFLLGSPGSRLDLVGNTVFNGTDNSPVLVGFAKGATKDSISGKGNWLSAAYQKNESGLKTTLQTWGVSPAPDFLSTLVKGSSESIGRSSYLDGDGKKQDGRRQYRYVGQGKWSRSPAVGVGAG